MKTLRCAVVLLTLGAALPAVAASQEEIRQLIENQQYSQAVAAADLMLNDRQTPATDRYNLLMLKGEAALRANQKTLAIAAFRAATRNAPDRPQAIAAAANAILLQHSNNGIVHIVNQDYPIIRPDDRRVAMQKLADDLLTNQARQVQTALDARTLDPILSVLPDVYRMYVLETQATDGHSTVAEPLARKLGTQAYDLIADELRRLQREVNYTEQSTYTIADSTGGWGVRGIIPTQRTDMRNRSAYIDRIRNAILQIHRLADTLRINTAPWDGLISQCDDLQDQINLVLARNY